MPDREPFADAGLRDLGPAVIGILVGRGADFAAAEALAPWPSDPPRDRRGWLVTVAWRKFLDAVRAEGSRVRREERVAATALPEPGAVVASEDDTLDLYFLCAHPDLSPSSAVALTL